MFYVGFASHVLWHSTWQHWLTLNYTFRNNLSYSSNTMMIILPSITFYIKERTHIISFGYNMLPSDLNIYLIEKSSHNHKIKRAVKYRYHFQAWQKTILAFFITMRVVFLHIFPAERFLKHLQDEITHGLTTKMKLYQTRALYIWTV